VCPLSEFIIRLICCSQLTSISKPAFGSPPPLPSNRLLISSISVLLVMTENQANVPVDSCYQVECDKCGKTTWKVISFFRCALIVTIDPRPAYFIRAVECMLSR